MVSLIRGWFYPTHQTGHPTQQDSSAVGDTVLSVALGAIALIAANACDRQSPGLAVLLRLVAGGIGLFWLFKRCCPDGSDGYGYHHQRSPVVVTPPVIIQEMPSSPRSYWRSWSNWSNWSNWFPRPLHTAPVSRQPTGPVYTDYGSSHQTHPTVISGGFPQVYPPKDPSLHTAPVSRQPTGPVYTDHGSSHQTHPTVISGGFPQVYPPKDPSLHTAPVSRQPTGPAYTDHGSSHQTHPTVLSGGFPKIYPDLGDSPMHSTSVSRQPTGPAYTSYGSSHKVNSTVHSGGFPQVYQPKDSSMHSAPVSRSTSTSFPTASRSGYQGGKHDGLFEAAKTRK